MFGWGQLPISLVIISTKTRHHPNVYLMLAHRMRRWSNIKTTLLQLPVTAVEIYCCQVWYAVREEIK